MKKTKVKNSRESDAVLLLRAILHGGARWEPCAGDEFSGEVCVGGLRFTCKIDAIGVPILYQNLRSQLCRSIGESWD